MPADVIDFTDLVEHDVTSTDDFQTLCELGLFPGKYLVIAKGDVWTNAAELRLRLEVGGASDAVTIGPNADTGTFDVKDAFCLTVATTIPLSSAEQFAFIRGRKVNQTEFGRAHLSHAKIVALSVDSVTTTAAFP